jgi:hypothetical protein
MLTTNAERRVHHMERARIVKEWRAATCVLAKATKLPFFRGVVMSASIQQEKGRIADAGGHFPIVKAAIDGLVDAGCLLDDGPECVWQLIQFPPTRGDNQVTLRIVGYPYPRPERTASDVLSDRGGRRKRLIADEQGRCPHVKRMVGVCIECGEGAP